MMDNSILNWTLKIIIYMSAVLSVWKTKNKIVHIILECIYCVVISVLPVLFISLLIVAINGSESVDVGIVMGLVSFLVVGPLVYFAISNRGEEKKIEDYFLLGALYIDEYKNNKPEIKRYKFILAAEVIHFLLLFMGALWGIVSLIEALEVLSADTFMIAFVISLFLAYALFVYGKCENEIRQRRKAILGVFISLVWLIIVCIRINHYWKDMTQIGLEDMFILFFSAVFTIPTIYEWLKNIPAKLVETHSKRVYERKDEMLMEHSRAKEECKKLGIQFLDELKEGIKLIIFKWKNGEKKRIITFFVYIFVVAVIMFVMIWFGMDSEIDIINGYNSGADDYVTKPFSLMVLMSKVNVLMRRMADNNQLILIADDITVNVKEAKVSKAGQEIVLSKTEIQLLIYFLENAGQILSKEMILERVWGNAGQFVDENTVTVNISRLKSKLETESISNVRGLGYLWTGQVIKK